MSVLSYIQKRSSDAVLSANEKSSVGTSISTLQTRLNAYFGTNISSHFVFGSFTRDTILPRAMDEHSDIDYMIAFSESGDQPQTYLDRLKRFVENKYQTSEVKQSSPTIVLELNHIKFELVPALISFPSGFKIPNGSNQWQNTNPNDFNASLTSKNQACGYHLKPAIRLAKFWNARNGYVFDSYGLEKWIVEQSYWSCNNQRDYLFAIFDKLPVPTDTQWRKERVERAKKIIADTRSYEAGSMPVAAEQEVKKLIPE